MIPNWQNPQLANSGQVVQFYRNWVLRAAERETAVSERVSTASCHFPNGPSFIKTRGFSRPLTEASHPLSFAGKARPNAEALSAGGDNFLP